MRGKKESKNNIKRFTAELDIDIYIYMREIKGQEILNSGESEGGKSLIYKILVFILLKVGIIL